MTTIDTGLSENELLAELARELQEQEYKPTREPGDFTLKELMKVSGLGKDKAREFLQAKCKAGTLVLLRVRDSDGRCVYVYRKVK